jgi:prepilin-type N-terminal cleavage/methylation domain-containing protein
MTRSSLEQGFTLIEMLVVLGVISILAFVATLNLFAIQNNSDLNTSLNTVVADIKQQQLKAMVGDTESRSSGDSYGIHFNNTQYVLFHGTTFSSGDSSNFPVNLDGALVFTAVTLPGSNVIFNQINGEMNGFADGSNTVSIKNTNTNLQKTIQFNRYGVITVN